MPQPIINLTYSCNRNCDFCFAKGFSKRWPREITLKDLEYVFEWLARQGKKQVSFGGGEPTLFSNINPALDLAEEYGLGVILYTNGLFDINQINIQSPAIALFGINLSPPSNYSSSQLRTLYSNLRALRRVSQRMGFRFNIVSSDDPYDFLIEACKRLEVRQVGFSLAIPSFLEQNRHVKKEEFEKFPSYILRLTKDLLKNNIQHFSYCPLPLCIFSKRERKFLEKENGLRGLCDIGRSYAVTPNLTVLPCSALAVEGPSLKDFEKEKEIFDYYKKLINKLKWEMDLFPECKDCVFKKERKCQGSCLIYKII